MNKEPGVTSGVYYFMSRRRAQLQSFREEFNADKRHRCKQQLNTMVHGQVTRTYPADYLWDYVCTKNSILELDRKQSEKQKEKHAYRNPADPQAGEEPG